MDGMRTPWSKASPFGSACGRPEGGYSSPQNRSRSDRSPSSDSSSLTPTEAGAGSTTRIGSSASSTVRGAPSTLMGAASDFGGDSFIVVGASPVGGLAG